MDDHVLQRRLPLLFAIGAITCIAAILRFYDLGRRDYWFDESCTYIYISKFLSWPEGWHGLLRESTNLPYYALLWGWSQVFSDSQASLRGMSALAGAFTIPVVAIIAYRLRGIAAAIVCGLLAATNPMHIHYSREARAYALWMLTLSIATLLLIEAAKRKSWRWWIAFGLATFFNLHLHYWTFFWIPATAAVILLVRNFGEKRGGDSQTPLPHGGRGHGDGVWRSTLTCWLATVGCTLIAFIPYLVFAVIPAARGGGSLWIERHFDALTAIPRSLWAMLPAGEYPAHLRGLSLQSPDTMTHLPNAVTKMAPIVSVVVVISLILLLLLRRVARVKTLSIHAFAASITIGPLILALAHSLFVRPNYLVGRYDIVAWPGAMLWLTLLVVDACGMFSFNEPRTSVRADSASSRARLGKNETDIASPLTKGLRATKAEARRRGVSFHSPLISVTGFFALCAFVPLERELIGETRASLAHRRAQRIAELTSPGDLVIAFSYDRDYLLYDLHRAGFRGQIRSFPTWLENQVGWLDTSSDLSPDRRAALRESAEMLAREAQTVLSRGGIVFILADSADPTNEGPRAEINRALLDKFQSLGCEIVQADEAMRIFALVCSRNWK
ncbi:MAG: glycosyltransferase family 39 protein [Planctomycetes bacterium]|nr:glycosyltransferase family 39 protein [Planctomycetota bacterium]MBI3834833.1 glycosyltransferase family 39 protein [Planctomycetota bacterium]